MLPPINEGYHKSISNEHCKKKKKKELEDLAEDYSTDVDKNETRSCFLLLNDIKFLIEYYSDSKNLNGENAIDGFRILFFRENPNKKYSYPGQKILKVGNKGQMSIILVPVHNYKYPAEKIPIEGKPAFQTEYMFDSNDECLVLTPGGEHTGLCPTNCPKG